MAEASGIRSAIWVALRKDDALLGYINVYRQEIRPFSDKQIALVQNFAAQAVIAMENARLLTETREALEQQTATAEVLHVINSSPGNLAPVFDAILEKAHILCGAAIGALVVRDGDVFRTVATHGLPEQFDKLLHQPLPVYTTGGLHERLLQGERLIHIPDQAASEQTNPWSRASVEIAGTRTLLAIALRKDDALLGYITASRQEVRPFSDKQIALLQNFAAQAVISMENARLLTETREALKQQTATAAVLRVISSSPTDLQPTLDAIAANATILTGAANGSVSRFDGFLVHASAHYGWSVEEIESIQRDYPRPPGLESTTGRAILTRDVVHVPDVRADPEYGLRSVLQTGMRTGLSVPILQDGNPVGAITVTRREVAPFSEAQIALLKTFADQAVIAIENVRLFNETREALEQQTATAEILQVINSSPGNLTPVFDAMLEKALSLCDAQFGGLTEYDGESFNTVALGGIPPELTDIVSAPQRALPGSNHERLVRGEALVHIPDLAAPELLQTQVSQSRGMAEIGGARTALLLALRKDSLAVEREGPTARILGLRARRVRGHQTLAVHQSSSESRAS
jgi:GAF domain-containing protein